MNLLSLVLTICCSVREVKHLTEKDFALDKLIIYFHDSNLDLECDSCKRFVDLPNKVGEFEVRRVDYSHNEEMSLRFFVLYVPHFCLRYKNCTYTLYPTSIDHLHEIIAKKLWTKEDKFSWVLEPNRPYMKMFGKLMRNLLHISDIVSMYYFNMPKIYVYMIYFGIFSYLVVSIFYILQDLLGESKIKEE